MIDTSLDGRIVLVTGGAAGIGAAICRAFAAQGAHIALHFLPATRPAAPAGVSWEHQCPAAQQAEQLVSDLPVSAALTPADLSEPLAHRTLFDQVEQLLGPVDVLVNNAAHCESPDTIDELSADGLERHYRVNAVAPAMLTHELARRRTSAAEASVINISTDAARAFPGQLGYGSSKGALEALTRATALDLASRGIRVNAVAPGPVQTGWMDDEILQHATGIVPMGRVGFPDDIADAVVFLASHQARWITGQVLQVAGGHAL